MEKYTLFFLGGFVAEVIGTVSGFGSSILFVPLASLFFDFQVVLGITAVFHVFSNLSKIALFREGIDKHIALWLGIPAILFVIIGGFLSKMIPQSELELGMNLLLLLLAVVLMIFSQKTLAQSNNNLVAGGVLSGFFAGLVGTGGTIRGLTLAAFNLEKNIFLATSALIDLGVDVSRSIVYFLNGYIQKEFLFTIPVLIVISLLGSWTGKKILDYIPQQWFKYIVLGVILATSLFQMIQYLRK